MLVSRVCSFFFCSFFFFKQKTAYEMRISDWSSDVCSSDLEDAKALLAAKKNLRLLVTGGMADPLSPGWFVKSVAGGYLAQTRDAGRITEAELKVVTKRAPTAQELADMLFAFRVGKHVKSNTIIYVKNGATVDRKSTRLNYSH